jgi:MFS family permease
VSGPGTPNRDLRLIAGAIGLSAIGDGAALIALALAARTMAGSDMRSGLAVSGVFICLWAPLALLSGHVGLLVDRYENRALLVIASVAQTVVAVGLAFVHSLAALLALTVALGAGVSVSQAAEFALVPAAVGARTLQEANSLVETARAFGFMVGPACGGLLVAAGGTRAAMLVDAASFVVVAGGGLALAARRHPSSASSRERRRARDGLAFLFSEPTLGLAMIVAFASLLFMSASIPADVVYVKDVLRIGDAAVGLVLSAWTIGMLLGSNVVARRIPLAAIAVAAFAGVTLQGIGKAIAPFWQTFAFMAAAYVAGGIGHGLKNVAFRTLIHARVPADRHGRVFAAYSGLRNTAELGALALGGVVVGLVGARWTLWLAGGLSAAVGVAGLAILRRGGRPTSDALATTAS